MKKFAVSLLILSSYGYATIKEMVPAQNGFDPQLLTPYAGPLVMSDDSAHPDLSPLQGAVMYAEVRDMCTTSYYVVQNTQDATQVAKEALQNNHTIRWLSWQFIPIITPKAKKPSRIERFFGFKK